MSDARAPRPLAVAPRRFALDVTLGVFLACMVALSAPWTTGKYALPWDAAAHFYPQFVFLSDALHAGDSPFWNPYVFAGHPQIADPQALLGRDGKITALPVEHAEPLRIDAVRSARAPIGLE